MLLLASMSAGAIFLVLVLYSTLGQAQMDGQQRRISLTRQTKVKAIPCKDADRGISLWTTGVQVDTGPHSLAFQTSSYMEHVVSMGTTILHVFRKSLVLCDNTWE